jgi:hypothetical protein
MTPLEGVTTHHRKYVMLNLPPVKLSAKQVLYLRAWLSTAPPLLSLTPNESLFFRVVEERTLRWHKIAEEIPSSHFLEGRPSCQLWPTFSSKSRLSEAKAGLQKKNILAACIYKQKPCMFLNIPHICHLFIASLERSKANGYQNEVKQLQDIADIVDDWLQMTGLVKPMEDKMNLEDLRAVVSTIEKEATQRRATKAKKKENLTLGRAVDIIQAVLDEHHGGRIRVSASRISRVHAKLKRMGQEYGDRAVWLLEGAARFWPFIAVSLNDKCGNKVFVSSSVIDMEWLYDHRNTIEIWLHTREIAGASQPDLHVVADKIRNLTVVDLRGIK